MAELAPPPPPPDAPAPPKPKKPRKKGPTRAQLAASAAARGRLFSAQIEGLKELQAALRKAGADVDDMTAAHQAVGNEIAQVGRREVPVRSGRLRNTIHGEGEPRRAIVVAGTDAVPYAGPIHFGDPFRGVGVGMTGAQLIDVLGSRGSRLASDRTLKRLAQRNKGKFRAVRDRSTGRFVKGAKGEFVGAQKGGPIPPNPFLYRALDQRYDRVLRTYDRYIDGVTAAMREGQLT